MGDGILMDKFLYLLLRKRLRSILGNLVFEVTDAVHCRVSY